MNAHFCSQIVRAMGVTTESIHLGIENRFAKTATYGCGGYRGQTQNMTLPRFEPLCVHQARSSIFCTEAEPPRLTGRSYASHPRGLCVKIHNHKASGRGACPTLLLPILPRRLGVTPIT